MQAPFFPACRLSFADGDEASRLSFFTAAQRLCAETHYLGDSDTNLGTACLTQCAGTLTRALVVFMEERM